jgi:hypothetical protein
LSYKASEPETECDGVGVHWVRTLGVLQVGIDHLIAVVIESPEQQYLDVEECPPSGSKDQTH